MTFDFSGSLRNLQARPSPNFDPYDPFTAVASPTYRALGNVIQPIATRALTSLPILRSSAPADLPSPAVPGPLSTWQDPDAFRPYQQTGKFGVNLLGEQPGITPQVVQPDAAAMLRSAADPNNPDNRGFIEGLLGGIGGIFGQGGKDVGSFVGSAFDLPFEAAGNIVGLVPTLATTQGKTYDPDLQAIYDEATKGNPVQGLLLLGQLAKAQWSRDELAGKHTGLFGDFGPATNPVELLGLVLAGASSGMRWVQRQAIEHGFPGVAGGAGGSIRTIEQAIAEGATAEEVLDETGAPTGEYRSTDERVRNNIYAEMQFRLQRGDFGPVGSKEARDKVMDQLVIEGALLRDVGDENQVSALFNPVADRAHSSVLGFTGQGLADLAVSIFTDPLIIGDAMVGLGVKVAKAGAIAANSRFWKAIPREVLDDVVDDVGRTAMRLGNYDSAERAWVELGRSARSDPGFEMRVLNEVINQPKYADIRGQATDALQQMERWRTTWEPALRPLVSTVHTLNDPFRLFGKDRAAGLTGSVFNQHATEGVIRGTGSLPAHVNVQRLLGESENMLAAYNRGLGTFAAFEARVYHRASLVSDLRRRLLGGDATVGDLFKHKPDEAISARLRGSTAGDVASGLEKQALRHRQLFLATERGGEEAALQRGRADMAGRLQLMGMAPSESVAATARMGRDELALVDAAYFGYAMDDFVRLRQQALAAGAKGIDYNRLSMLGPRQLTEQGAQVLLDAVDRGAISEVRRALERYDLLYENLSENLNDAQLLSAVRELVEDQLAAGALPRELEVLTGLTDEMQRWAEANAENGYRLGFIPDEPEKLWRATVDADGRVVGLNPWVEPVGFASDVPTYTRGQLLRDTLFHNIRGERIMADARVRLAKYTSNQWGLPRADSDALFARFLRMAQESGITPRGMTPEQVFKIIHSQGLPREIADGIGVREAIEALLFAFEGNWRHVGLTQKFTGGAKTALGGQSNWLGQVAERIYPAVRFTLNPLFQAQEMVEPFVMNTVRGIKPGFRASDLDEKTLRLIEVLIRDSKYAFDDQIERDAVLLWGADSARQAFGSNSRLGRLVSRMTINGVINVKEVKRVNYARAARRQLGIEFRKAIERVSPDLAAKLPANYQTGDWGEIAVRYLTEKGSIETPTDVLKPEYLGARSPVNLDKVARHFDGAPDGAALRALVADGSLDEAAFRDTLINAGADPDFASRAFVTAAATFTPDEWWAEFRTTFGASQKQTAMLRRLMEQFARAHDMSLEEYMAKRFADVPMSADSKTLMALAENDKAGFQMMAEAVDEGLGRTMAQEERIAQFRQQWAYGADREHFAIIDPEGNVLAQGEQNHAWTVRPDGAHVDASLGDEIEPFLPRANGNVLVHNHPSHNPFSPADMATAARYRVSEMVVTSPGITYTLKPNLEEGWFTAEFRSIFGEPPGLDVPEVAQDQWWANVYNQFAAMWQNAAQDLVQSWRQAPFYANTRSDFYDAMLDSLATNLSVERMAAQFDWDFHALTDFRLPTDAAARHELLQRIAENPPEHLQMLAPYVFRAEPLVRSDLRAGASVAAEYTSRHRNWMPEGLPEEVQRQVMDGWEDWFRAKVLPRFGALVTDVRRARGGWADPTSGFTDEVNTVMDVFAPDDGAVDVARAIGFLLKQDAVVVSRPKVGLNVADAAANERWALDFIADRELTGEEAAGLARSIGSKATTVGGWGSSVVTTADGRTAVRFINYDQTGTLSREDFISSIREDVDRWSLGGRDHGVEGFIEIHPNVVDYHYVTNDWDGAASHGEDYLAGIRQRRPDMAAELEGGLAQESENVLAGLVRAHDPAGFNAHLDALRARGESIPDLRPPGAYEPAPLGDRVIIEVPGGREALLNNPERTFTLWEQQLLKAQVIDARAAYNADPDLYAALMRAIWRSKERDLEGAGDLLDHFNAFAFAALTPNSTLDSSEGAYALLRARRPQQIGLYSGTDGITARTVQAQRVAASLPPEWRDSADALGVAFQLDEGLRYSGFDLRQANWLDPEQRTMLDRVLTRIDQKMRSLPPERREAWAKAINTRLYRTLNRSRAIQVQVHPFPTKRAHALGPSGMAELLSFTSIARPGVRYRGLTTGMGWGQVLKWLKDDLFSTTEVSPGLSQFMRIAPGESRAQYALRMGSILPGIDAKTGLMAMQAAGPGHLAHGALDTHIVRFIMQSAAQRGDLDDLLGRLSTGYANQMRTQVGRIADGMSSAFPSPTTNRVYLVPERLRNAEWGPAKLEAMQARLHLIPDPEMRRLYESPVVLERVARTGGKVNLWGGDYAVLDDYFNTVLRADEVASLRAAGHERAAQIVENMSGGEWQWFKWDQIRSASVGTPLDPHVGLSRGAELLPQRSGIELDRNIMVSRLRSPYDPINSMVLQQIDGRALGANQIMEDGRRILLATQHADGRTGLHELAHVFEQDLDPSMREQILDEFRKATGSRRRTWSREVSEWWADSLLDYAKTRGRGKNPALRSSFEYFRKTLNGIEASIKAEAEKKVLQRTKDTAIRRATKQVEKATPVLREAEQATKTAHRVYERASRELRRARARASLPTLEARAGALKDTVLHVDQNLKDARAAVRAAMSEAKAADLRATRALGTPQAGSLRAAANRRAREIEVATQRVKSLSKELDTARKAHARASQAVGAARRRVPVGDLQAARDSAQAAAQKALRAQRDARKALDQARRALDDAKGLSTRPARSRATVPAMSPDMRRVWDTMTTPPETPSIIAGTGQPYDLQQEAVYQAARLAVSRAEENAFTLHYYKRGRSFVERSINHPYFGLYPASYMWGKVLPEMVRFLVKTPFGIEAPLGGLLLANNIYRQVLTQQQYDPDFRQAMVENSDFWHFVALMTPSLPWEVPVNAPLWMRRISEGALDYDDKLAEYQQRAAAGLLTPSEKPPALRDLNDIGNIGAEMLNYAFGPANAVKELTGAISGIGHVGQSATDVAVGQVQRLMQNQPAPLPAPATVPSQEPAPTGGY